MGRPKGSKNKPKATDLIKAPDVAAVPEKMTREELRYRADRRDVSVYGTKKSWTAEELAPEMDAYIAECCALDVFPTDFDLITRFGVSYETIMRWRRGAERYEAFAPILATLKAYCESYLVKHGLTDDTKRQTFFIYLTKQEKYGGYRDDKSGGGGTINVNLKLAGAGDKPFE